RRRRRGTRLRIAHGRGLAPHVDPARRAADAQREGRAGPAPRGARGIARERGMSPVLAASNGNAIVLRLEALGVPLADLTADSRAVKLGSVFVAYPGTVRDGRTFIPEAIAHGAAAVIWEK